MEEIDALFYPHPIINRWFIAPYSIQMAFTVNEDKSRSEGKEIIRKKDAFAYKSDLFV